MAFITREDGVNFVIPSYREVLTAKQKAAIKEDVIALSQSYGEYITMQEKGDDKYELAFSPDLGYLLGETVWYSFNRPVDLIYCEAITDTSDAILVIVKDGSVYLDGRFTIESIPEELIILLTQQNNFDIYVYGDVPISDIPTDGKFSFDPSSVKSFNVLTDSTFNSLPLLKPYHLEPVKDVLRAHGVGTLPIKQFGIVVVLGIIGWLFYGYMTKEAEKPKEVIVEPNPFENYVNALASPPPDQLLVQFVDRLSRLYSIGGWRPKEVSLSGTTVEGKMISTGGTMEALLAWCTQNDARFGIKSTGIFVYQTIKLPARPKPKLIFPIKEAMTMLLDNLVGVYPKARRSGLTLADNKVTGPYTSYKVILAMTDITPELLLLISKQLADMPVTLDNIKLVTDKALMNGSITVSAMGN